MGATLNKTALANVAVPLPPLDEQRRIAAILDRAEGLLTGSKTVAAEAAALQLSVYRVAYARWTGLPVEQVRAAFYYGATGETVRPVLADEQGIEALLRP